MKTRRDIFQAIADPTRRQIIGLLSQKSLNVNSIANKFDVSRQAVSLHVKILVECDLITIKQEGRERICEAKFDKLQEVSTWVEQYKSFWTGRFAALEQHLTEIQLKNKDHEG